MSESRVQSAYLQLPPGELRRRAVRGREMLAECRLCPRECGVDRSAGELGFCRTGTDVKVAAAQLHFGEEQPLVGRGGSGTIFLAGCNLGCVFCQNREISRARLGRICHADTVAAMMLKLADAGSENINWVTPSHVVPQLLEGLADAAEAGLTLPIVYNSSGYDSRVMLDLLDGIVDIYMPDLKTLDGDLARDWLGAADYPAVVTAAIREMHRQVGPLAINNRGVAVRGLLVRHLVMPGRLVDTARICRWIAEELGRETCLNIMPQYRPAGRASGREGLDRPLTSNECRQANRMAREAGLTRLDKG